MTRQAAHAEKTGDVGVLRAPEGAGSVQVFADRAAVNTFYRANASKDRQGVTALLNSGRLYIVDVGTKVQVLDAPKTASQSEVDQFLREHKAAESPDEDEDIEIPEPDNPSKSVEEALSNPVFDPASRRYIVVKEIRILEGKFEGRRAILKVITSLRLNRAVHSQHPDTIFSKLNTTKSFASANFRTEFYLSLTSTLLAKTPRVARRWKGTSF